MDDITKKHLTRMLEGYTMNLQQVNQAVEGMESQLEQAVSSRDEMVKGISELKDLLGIPQDEEVPTPMPTS